MYQLTVSVSTLDQLYTLSGHLAELGFLFEPAAEQATPPVREAQSAAEGETPAPILTSNGSTGESLATDRQINYLNDLALKAGWDLHVFEEAVTALFDLDDFAQLAKRMASDLITWLQQDDFRPTHRS